MNLSNYLSCLQQQQPYQLNSLQWRHVGKDSRENAWYEKKKHKFIWIAKRGPKLIPQNWEMTIERLINYNIKVGSSQKVQTVKNTNGVVDVIYNWLIIHFHSLFYKLMVYFINIW